MEATFSLPNDLALSPDGQVLYLNQIVAETDDINYSGVIRAILLPHQE